MKFTDINIGRRLAVTFGTTTLLTLVLLFVSHQAIDNLSNRWAQFHSGSLEKYTAAFKGESDLGNGIHHFKNYLLRGQDYDQKFMADMAAIDQDAADYARNHGDMNEREKAALLQIKEATDAYRAAIKKAIELKTSGTTIEEIDKSVKGADKPLGKAFDELLTIVQEETNVTSQSIFNVATSSKREIILVGILITVLSMLFAWLTATSITRPLQNAVEVAGAVAQGDLTLRIEVKSKDEVGQLLQALKNMNDNLTGIVGDVRNTTESVTTASQEIAQGSIDLSQRTEEQASSLEETASSMEELTSTMHRNTENARHADHLAQGTSDVAEQSGEAVAKLVATMTAIHESSRKVEDIIGVIDGIAFQTNILALNAAVEAARAGEQGRGFAVVAGEVRNLAQRSASAAKEIKLLINDSVGKVNVGSSQVKEAADGISDVVTSVQMLASLMKDISAATIEQSASIEQVNQSITQIDEITQQNAAQVEEAAAAAESMREQANTLMQAVSVFRLEAGRMTSPAIKAKPKSKPVALAHAPHRVPAIPLRNTRKLYSKSSAGGEGDWKEF